MGQGKGMYTVVLVVTYLTLNGHGNLLPMIRARSGVSVAYCWISLRGSESSLSLVVFRTASANSQHGLRLSLPRQAAVLAR